MNNIQLYPWTHEAWQAMYDDCARAERSIEFEQYIIRNDEVGHKFLTLFADKARQGVKVRLLLDRVGSRTVFSSPFISHIMDNGGEVIFYNPIRWINLLTPWRWFPRNHVKTLLIDSHTAYVGGVCLADYMADWRDLHARITGAPIKIIEADFARTWGRMSERKIRRRDRHEDNGDTDYIVARPSFPSHPIYERLLAQIAQAEKTICLATPYFMPPKRLRRALKKAALRGVDIKVIVSEQTDVPLAVYVSRSYFPYLIKHGIRVFSYKKTVIHAKYAVIDGQWATMGSTNMDYLSLLRNREANLIINDPAVINGIQQHFHGSLAESEELEKDFWHHIPLPAKLAGYLGRPMKKMI